MRILDRYIIRYFVINYAILMFVIMALFVLVEFILDLDEFLEAAQVRAAASGGGVIWATLWTIGDFEGPRLLLLFAFFSGLLVVGAMGFTFQAMTRSGELVAMVSGGISMYRLAAPVLVAGCVLSGLALPNQEYLIPKLAHKLARSKAQVRYDAVRSFSVSYAPDSNHNLLTAAEFDPKEQVLRRVTILVRDREGRAELRISAAEAHWSESRGGWRLVGGEAVRRSLDQQSLGEQAGGAGDRVEFFHTDLSPQLLLARRARNYPALLSFQDLHRLINNPAVQQDAGEVRQLRQIVYSRFSLLVVNVLMLAITLPFFLLREPANPLLQAAKAAVTCLGLWGTAMVVTQMGTSNLTPGMAAWLPVAVLIPVSVLMLMTVKT